jgi:anti-sigma B factor antagonist
MESVGKDIMSHQGIICESRRCGDGWQIEGGRRSSTSASCRIRKFRPAAGDFVDLDIRQTGSICTLKVKGRFKSDSVPAFDAAVESAIDTGHIYLILDLEDVPMIDSSAIGAVVNCLRLTKQIGGDTKLLNPSSFVAKTFKMVGILSLFGVFASEADAAAACGTN